MYGEFSHGLSADFLAETLQASWVWHEILKVLKEKDYNLGCSTQWVIIQLKESFSDNQRKRKETNRNSSQPLNQSKKKYF